VIDRQLTHVTRLVDDLLDVGRLTTGKIKLRRELTPYAEVVRRAVETVRPVMEARRHTLSVHMPPQPVNLNCDPTRISQVLQNLLVNAAKFTPEGGHIEVKVVEALGFVTTTVTDNGRGIEPGEMAHVFQLFGQGEQSLPNESGLGIGLTLARSLVEMHGGSLDGYSAGRGQGASFSYRLPSSTAQLQPASDEPGVVTEGGARVMVVDDNRDAADSTTAILRLLGYRVECVYDGQSALAMAAELQPQVVMLDLAMPGIDGFETRRLLAQLSGFEGTYTIAMTGYGNEDDKRRTRAAGFDAHLTKPVELESLMKLLNEARDRAR
jgi:CheY-like chemotaxis protein